MRNSHRHGFTLIELSIVLVIIGLIIGGVLVGRDLITAAQMRKQMRTVDEVKLAFNAFKLKYNCLPGDCAKAGEFGFTHYVGPSTDGNGDGRIANFDPGNGIGRMEVDNTMFHLNDAKLTRFPYELNDNGFYTMPDSSFLGTDESFKTLFDSADWWPNAAIPSGAGFWVIWAIESSQPASLVYMFDTKFDDGNGITGQIKIIWEEFDTSDPGTCMDASGVYRLEGATANYCHIYIDLPY